MVRRTEHVSNVRVVHSRIRRRLIAHLQIADDFPQAAEINLSHGAVYLPLLVPNRKFALNKVDVVLGLQNILQDGIDLDGSFVL